MFLIRVGVTSGTNRFPRIRGDVPNPAVTRPGVDDVFPAYAGMFRPSVLHPELLSGFPRIRGDVPHTPTKPTVTLEFSPHTRGYSRGKACNEEDSSEKNLVNKEAYSASRLSALVTA